MQEWVVPIRKIKEHVCELLSEQLNIICSHRCSNIIISIKISLFIFIDT